ncbi:MAG: hypothetical protein HQL18_01225 [Candidatus Omnitrophica bacterium]|nr:hypothetical protein [Candidatus Omnitrophota bacterium]
MRRWAKIYLTSAWIPVVSFSSFYLLVWGLHALNIFSCLGDRKADISGVLVVLVGIFLFAIPVASMYQLRKGFWERAALNVILSFVCFLALSYGGYARIGFFKAPIAGNSLPVSDTSKASQ